MQHSTREHVHEITPKQRGKIMKPQNTIKTCSLWESSMRHSYEQLTESGALIGSNDDLLTEILLRVPATSIFQFKSVSKRWLSLITNPYFTLRRSQSHIIDPPSGIFLLRQHHFQYDFIPLDIGIPTSPSPATFTLDFDSHEVRILQSCNGLLLCRTMTHTMTRTGTTNKLYVYNPSLRRFTTIPQCHYPEYFPDSGDLRMAFDPTKSPHYKIVLAESRLSIRIQTYSSKTDNWSVCGDKFSFHSFRYFSRGIYWNDTIHWVNGPSHLKLDVEHLSLTRTETPRSLDEKKYCEQKLFESRGCLLLCKEDIRTCFVLLNIYEMSKRDSRWLVKYIVNLDDIRMKYPKPWAESPGWFCSRVLCVMIEEKEEDSFLVMEISGKIIQYKIVLKTICKVYELKTNDRSTSFQFIASFADV